MYMRQHVRKSFHIYKIKSQQEINENPQSFYNFVREFPKKSDDFLANTSYKDMKGNTPNDIADLFRFFLNQCIVKQKLTIVPLIC